MEFDNPELDISQLPKAEDCTLKTIDQRYYTVVTYNHVILWIVLFVATLVIIIVTEDLRSWLAAGLSLSFFAALCFAHFRITYLSFKNKGYAIRSRDIMYQTGWLNKSLHIIPYSRIQHCSIDAGVFERNLGISKLKIYTAGGDQSDLVIPGLEPDEANSLREFIITRNQEE